MSNLICKFFRPDFIDESDIVVTIFLMFFAIKT